MTAPSQRPIDYSHYLPWTRLLRSFRIATDPRKLALAAVAITLFWCGDRALSLLPFSPAASDASPPPWNAVEPTLLVNGFGAPTFYEAPRDRFLALESRLLTPLRPLFAVAGLPFGEKPSWTDLAHLWTRLLWALALWALFGGAIARIAAVEFARDERISLAASLKFAARRFVSLFSAPLLPLLGILVLWGVCALGGSIGRIPFAGDWIVASLWGLAALTGLLLVIVAVATAFAWPLMIAGIATEGSDAFDGFSRSFSYLYGRPWLFVWYIGLALLLGPFLVAAVDTISVAAVTAAERTVGTGMGARAAADLHSAAPGYFQSIATSSAVTGPALIVAVWLSVVATLAVGFAASYFWTAATIVYFLLRRADDATHFDEVWLGEQDEEDDLLPLAGIASTDQPVVERSHHPTVGPPLETKPIA